MDYLKIKLLCSFLATIGLYTVLYKENKFYRFFEHLFLGLAAGWSIVAIWTETLKPQWYNQILGQAASDGHPGTPGYWAYVLLLPIGLLGYFVFSPKHNWLSRIPIGVLLGLWSGQQVQVWWNRYGPQMNDSMKTIIPTTWSSFTVPSTANMSPDAAANVAAQTYPSQAISNFIFVVTLLSVISYFIFSMDFRHKALKGFTTLGRWLLMVGFGAIFGSTVMMRFSLLVDRMFFIWIEFLKHGMMGRVG